MKQSHSCCRLGLIVLQSHYTRALLLCPTIFNLGQALAFEISSSWSDSLVAQLLLEFLDAALKRDDPRLLYRTSLTVCLHQGGTGCCNGFRGPHWSAEVPSNSPREHFSFLWSKSEFMHSDSNPPMTCATFTFGSSPKALIALI